MEARPFQSPCSMPTSVVQRKQAQLGQRETLLLAPVSTELIKEGSLLECLCFFDTFAKSGSTVFVSLRKPELDGWRR